MEDSSLSSRVEQEKTLLEWKAPSRPYQKRSKEFMTVPAVIAFLVGLVLIVAGEWMLIAVVAALVFVYYAWSVIPPDLADYKFTTRGLRIDGKLYTWEEFTRWWLGDKWGQALLYLETPVQVVGQVVVPLGDAKIADIEELLETMLLRDRPEDSRLDKAGKWLAEKFPLSQEKMQ